MKGITCKRLNGFRLLEKRSLVYVRALSLIQLLIRQGKESISLEELELYIKGHIGASPKTVRSYIKLLVQFELIKPDRWRLNLYKVNPEKCFFPPEEATAKNPVKEAQNELLPALKPSTSTAESEIEPPQTSQMHYNNTFVYNLQDRGAKEPISLRGYKKTFKRYYERVRSLGMDVCYVEDAWWNAFIAATDAAQNLIEVPIRIGLTPLLVTVVLPYVAGSKPRRQRKRITFEEEEF